MPYVGVKPAAITSATEAEISGDLTVDTSTLHVDASENKVGIGTVTPDTYSDYVSGSLTTGLAIAGSFPGIQLADTDVSGSDSTFGISKSGQDTVINNLGTSGTIKFYNAGGQRANITADGLTFGSDTAAANALNDYETGLHVTTATPNTSGSITLSSGADTFAYTKIGRLVYISGELAISSVSSPVGAVVDFTVPFACSSLSETSERSGGGVFWTDGGTGYFVLPAFTFSGAIIRIFKDASAFAANDAIAFGFSYITDS